MISRYRYSNIRNTLNQVTWHNMVRLESGFLCFLCFYVLRVKKCGVCKGVNLEGVNPVKTGTAYSIFTVNRGTGMKLRPL